MKVSSRELVLLLATGGVALFGGTAILGRARLEQLKSLREQQRQVRQEIERSERLIQSRGHWEDLFAELGKALPQFPAEKNVQVHWLTLMDQVAQRHGLQIAQRKAGDEEAVGGVYEMPIDVKEWSGSLEALTYFMFDLQNEGIMLDVRHLYVKPREDRNLRGRFTLYCAYMRGTASPRPAPAVPAPPAGQGAAVTNSGKEG